VKWVPHPYQFEGVKFLLDHSQAGLFLDPGMGKTSMTLTAVSLFREKGEINRVLIIAPIRPLYKVWPDEIKKWDHTRHLTYTLLHGYDKDENLNKMVDIYLINPEGLKWFMAAGGMDKVKPDMLVVDESTKFKDYSTARFKLMKPHLSRFKRRLALTGEPAPNGYMDLFAQCYIMDIGKALGKYITHFRAQYFFQENWDQYGWYLRLGADKLIEDKIRPLVMRLDATEHLDMPELIIQDIPVDLDAKSRKIYKDFEDEFLAEIDGTFIMTPTAAAKSSKCRQVANGGVYDENKLAIHIHDAKTQALVDLVEQLQGHPLFVCYEFIHDVDRIKRVLPKAVNLTGLSGTKLDKTINDFNAGKIEVLLGHTMSAGHGLNLQEACHHVCYYGLTWDLDGYHQFYKRIWRQGQKSPRVFLYRILAERTLDKTVAQRLHDKDLTQANFLDAIRSQL
jgi:SNF2 family DNA or RNA helicase